MADATGTDIVERMALAIVNRTYQGEAVERVWLIRQGFHPGELDRHFETASAVASKALRENGRVIEP